MSNILIIDDDNQLRSMLRQMLERDGYVVFDAKDGNEGLEIFNKEKFNLVITDMLMPEKDGVETTAELLIQDPDIKIIGLTGGGVEGFDFLHQAKHYGIHRTLSKPFGKNEMLTTVRELLNE